MIRIHKALCVTLLCIGYNGIAGMQERDYTGYDPMTYFQTKSWAYNIFRTPTDAAQRYLRSRQLETLKQAIYQHDTETAKQFVSQENVNSFDDISTLSLIHMATYVGSKDIVQFCIENKVNLEQEADVNISANDAKGRELRGTVRPIHIAAFYPYPDIVNQLAENGADVNAPAYLEQDATKPLTHTRALHLAAPTDNKRTIRHLKQKGAYQYTMDVNRLTPAEIARACNAYTALAELE